MRALFILVLVGLGAPALAARAIASATILMPAFVSPIQASLVVSVTTVNAAGYVCVTVAFN